MLWYRPSVAVNSLWYKQHSEGLKWRCEALGHPDFFEETVCSCPIGCSSCRIWQRVLARLFVALCLVLRSRSWYLVCSGYLSWQSSISNRETVCTAIGHQYTWS